MSKGKCLSISVKIKIVKVDDDKKIYSYCEITSYYSMVLVIWRRALKF